mgnify:CR=1 FL=1
MNRPSADADAGSREPLVDALLDDRDYHIEFKHMEFGGWLSNHAKHAVIALDRLGAPAERIADYYARYAAQTYGYGLEPPKVSEHDIDAGNWKAHLGRRSSYSAYCDFFDGEEKRMGMDAMLQRYLPELIPGWAGALAHGAIHLGWALDAGHRWMMIEGLAYQAFAYVSCHPEKNAPAPDDDATPTQSLLRIARAWETQGDAMRAWLDAAMADQTAFVHPDLARHGSQYKIARVLAQGHPLIHATPAWVRALPPGALWASLHYAVSLLYLVKPGDFTVLHLITSLHAMEHIAAPLSEAQQREAAACYWSGMLGILFSRGAFPAGVAIEELDERYRDAVDTDEAEAQADWERIVAKAIPDDEEHNPKLVYVERLAWRRYGQRTIFRDAADRFTTTPVLTAYKPPLIPIPAVS